MNTSMSVAQENNNSLPDIPAELHAAEIANAVKLREIEEAKVLLEKCLTQVRKLHFPCDVFYDKHICINARTMVMKKFEEAGYMINNIHTNMNYYFTIDNKYCKVTNE